MKKLLLTLVTALGLAVTVQAAPTPPDQMIKTSTDTLQGLISKNVEKYRSDKPGFYKVVDEVIVPHFDTKYIAQMVLARNWKAASPEQRSRFEVAFKTMLINSYADSLLTYYDSVSAEIKPPRMAAGATEATVGTSLIRKNAPPIALVFATRLVGQDWKIWDISVEGISLVTSFRSQINAEVQKNGLDSVIAKMESGQNIVAPATDSVGEKTGA